MKKDRIQENFYEDKELLLDDLPQMAGRTLYDRLKDIPLPKLPEDLARTLSNIRGTKIESWSIYNLPATEISDEAVRLIDPLVSVCVSVYNHERFLRECFEGIIKQKVNFPFEVVVGEDCSTDKSMDIILDYQKKYPQIFRIITSKTNLYQRGLSNPLRVRLATRGKYIAYCEGDDYWVDENKLQKQVDICKNHPDVNVVFTGGYHLFNDTQKLIPRYIHKFDGELKVKDDLYNVLTEEQYHQHRLCSAMFRTQIFVRRYSEDYFGTTRILVGDRKLWIYCALKGSIYYLNELTCVYRLHTSSLTSDDKTKYLVARDAGIVNLAYLYEFCNQPIFTQRNCVFLTQIYLANLRHKTNNENIFYSFYKSTESFVKYLLNSKIPFKIRLKVLLNVQKRQFIDTMKNLKICYIPLRFIYRVLKGKEWNKTRIENRFERF